MEATTVVFGALYWFKANYSDFVIDGWIVAHASFASARGIIEILMHTNQHCLFLNVIMMQCIIM